MLRTYEYILKLHHVEIEEYSIVHLLSPTCTSLDNLKSKKKTQFFFLKFIWMHIKYVINQHHCDKIKNHPHVDH
jgi:hypothetical protein